jgi:hypothetical protein
VAQLQHEVQRLEALPPKLHLVQMQRQMKMNLQILDEGLDSKKRGKLFHVLMSLKQDKNYNRESRFNPYTSVSFFNDIDTEKINMLIAGFIF